MPERGLPDIVKNRCDEGVFNVFCIGKNPERRYLGICQESVIYRH